MQKHHSCLNTRAIIEYFEEKLPSAVPRLFHGLGPEIEGLADPREFLMEINNWVSSDVVIQMFANAREITGDADIAFKIGFESAARKKLGYVQRIIMFAHKNPRRTLKRVQAINDRFNRNKVIELVETRRDSAIIRLHWLKHIPSVPDFCRFNQGIYVGIPTIWNLPPAQVEETRCYFRGDEYCEYHFTWQKTPSVKDSLLRLLVPWRLLKSTIEELERDKDLLKKKFDEVHRLNLQLKEKIDQLVCLQETSAAALSVLNLEELLQATLRLLLNSARLDRAGIFLLDEKSRVLELQHAVGIDAELFEKIRGYQVPLAKVDNIIARVALNGIPVVVDDVEHSKLNQANLLLQQFKPKAFILAPLTVRGKVIGVILADRCHQEASITTADKEFVVSFANQIAIALENAILYHKLELSERKYRELVENAHEGIWIVDDKGIIKFFNRRLTEITGYKNLAGKNIFDLVDWYNRKLLGNILAQNRKGKVVQREIELTRKNHGLAMVIVSSVPLLDNGTFKGAFAMLSDIAALRNIEIQFQKIFADAAIAMSLIDLEGFVVDCNQALEEMLGYERQELYHRFFIGLSHPDDVAAHTKLFRELTSGNRSSYSLTVRYLHKDGRLVWGQLTVCLLRDAGGSPIFAIGMVEDITERKQVEQEIGIYQEKLQSLALELSLTEERERRRLATELHDNIGQNLALAKIKLGVLQKSDSADHAKTIQEIQALIEKMIQDTRSLTFELSLPILYELGFEAAVEWLARHIRTQHGLLVEVRRDPEPIPMDDNVRVLIFRTVRELLMNTVKHAQANQARILIRKVDSHLCIEVEDDGVGIDDTKIDPLSPRSGGFGLFSIRERLKYLGGRLEIDSAPGRGTHNTVMLPLHYARNGYRGGL